MFGKVGEMKKLYDKYKQLQKVLKNLVIRAKEWEWDNNGEIESRIIVDINWEMKLKNISINDDTLLSPLNKEELETIITKCFQKAQNKAQEVVAEKTKDILGFDPNDMAAMMGGWWMPWLK